MTEQAEIRFLRFGGRRVAYAVTGDGPPLVTPAWWVSHLELDWKDQAFREFWNSVADGYTVVRYDRLGVGMSDRDLRDEDLTLECEVELLRAVLDELDLSEAVLVGGSSGGCAAVAFAARFPERVNRLLLYGAYPDGSLIAPPQVREAIVATLRSHWGLGSRVLADIFLGDSSSAEQERLARHQRAAASPETAAALLELLYRNDVRAESAGVRAPTLVVHRRGDRAVPYHLGRELAAAIPGATLIPLDGSAHFPWAGDALSVARAAIGPGARSSRARWRRACGGAAVWPGASGAGAGRKRAERPGSRRAAGLEPAHGAQARRQHPPQTRARFPYRCGR